MGMRLGSAAQRHERLVSFAGIHDKWFACLETQVSKFQSCEDLGKELMEKRDKCKVDSVCCTCKPAVSVGKRLPNLGIPQIGQKKIIFNMRKGYSSRLRNEFEVSNNILRRNAFQYSCDAGWNF